MIVFRSAAEAKAQLHLEIPNLATAEWRIQSPYDDNYQCIAWAACRTDRMWWPWDNTRFYWPPGFAKLPTLSPVPVENFAAVFERMFGYRNCPGPEFELGYQKIAIYANGMAGVTHIARQRLLGRRWLSKLGSEEDIVHDTLADVGGTSYGAAVHYMKRSWWTAFAKLCLFRHWWATLKFRIYRAVVPWDLS